MILAVVSVACWAKLPDERAAFWCMDIKENLRVHVSVESGIGKATWEG